MIGIRISRELKYSLIILIALLAFLAAPFLAPVDPLKIDLKERLLPASGSHFFGTDHLGRDIFSRLLAGAQNTVGTSLLILLLSCAIGLPIGLYCGYKSGIIDRIFMRMADAFMAFPDFIIAIILTGLIGPGMFNVVMSLVMVKWVGYARLVRSTILSEKEKEYIMMAKVNGAGDARILFRHLLPHAAGNLLVITTLDIGKIILLIASLSYIGLGAQPPVPEWGAMLNESKAFFYHTPHLMLYPGFAIMLTVLLFNLAGDRLRDRLDVRGRGGE
ncbi:ABC transporter permease subunit [Bacillus mangrovi]|uniref:ABC transporter permease subunit n=1 Tax=Metabacillus mangrovi TaxID=1491830 RepID=A0A7X2S681_9BACI|nr:nickel transporter permease [Metabacillus mangrovi]MTH54423.1 ABC transporter permease subunit [Metabacillus mangrovi]